VRVRGGAIGAAGALAFGRLDVGVAESARRH